MNIRLEGSKTEIETALSKMYKVFCDVVASKLYANRDGSFRCYVKVSTRDF